MTQQFPFGVPPQFANGPLTEPQRERVISHLQALYANGTLSEPELDRRLGLAFGARDRMELNVALHGLARIPPVMLTRPAPGQPTGAENVGAGLVHLSGLFTSFLTPVIVRAVATPGTRVWWEASRAFSLQLTAFVAGAAAMMLSMVLGLSGGLMGLGWFVWVGATIWASVRAFNGQSGTGTVEPYLLARPQAPRPAVGYTR